MASQEQIEAVAAAMRKIRPAPLFKLISESQTGIGAVMRYLSDADGEVTAGNIADFMGVSTARVAVLLKKLSAKGLIVKESAASDGRVTIVRLSDTGKQTAEAMRSGVCGKIGEAIDKIGMERMLEFLTIAGEISDIDPDLKDLF